MYTLRRISGQGVEMNHSLGKAYTVVHRYESYEAFRTDFERFYNKPHVADLDPTADDETKQVYAFVGNDDGSHIQPLYFGQQNYIMTESGKTFNNLTIKDERFMNKTGTGTSGQLIDWLSRRTESYIKDWYAGNITHEQVITDFSKVGFDMLK